MIVEEREQRCSQSSSAVSEVAPSLSPGGEKCPTLPCGICQLAHSSGKGHLLLHSARRCKRDRDGGVLSPPCHGVLRSDTWRAGGSRG